MPPTITEGKWEDSPTITEIEEKYSYKDRYPEGLDLRPSSDKHGALISRLSQMARDSRAVLSDRFDQWDSIDENLTQYIDLTDKQQADYDHEGYTKNKPVQVIVPMMSAIKDTLLTYLVSAFLEEPIFKYDWVGDTDSDVIGAMSLEKVVETQTRRHRVGLALHTMWDDDLKYGLGAVSVPWCVDYNLVTEEVPVYRRNWVGKQVLSGYKEVQREDIAFEGNRVDNINVRQFLPDPWQPAGKIQMGESVGWIHRTNYMNLLSEEQYDRKLFNIRYLKEMDAKSTLFEEASNRAGDKTHKPESTSNLYNRKPVDVTYMYVRLVPADWELGSGKYPELWLFAMAGHSLLIMAQPMKLKHNKFPAAVSAMETDGHSATPISRLETTWQLQKTIDFLFTSHVANVRKAINDMIIYDPSLINTLDLEDPTPGMLVRLRENAFGRGIGDAIDQFKVTDVTSGHIDSAYAMTDVAFKYTGAVDSVMGVMRRGSERRSAAEATAAHTSALSRLARLAYITSQQAMTDLAWLFGMQTQQLMSKKAYIRVAGDLQEALEEEYGIPISNDRLAIAPEMIQFGFDILPYDNTMIGGTNVEGIIQAMQIGAQNPMIATKVDLGKLFMRLMRELGIRNTDSIRIKTATREQMQPQIDAGNYAPAQEVERSDLGRAVA